MKNDSPLLVLLMAISTVKDNILDPTPFQLVMGSLAYLVRSSWPDLAFSVSYLAQHWAILDHVMSYLFKTKTHQLILLPEKVSLNLWSHTGWGGYLKRSQFGFILKLGDVPIIWSSKQQGVVAISTCPVEYMAL
ncbi:hypothetical protein O181_087072 [Austropuccinia psidii MF-1]|uniref:Reverse transcriptase Ty1/copia-type domain-containing protein n=1 Tax=Austropuccinia psidii MF-1 TaxID=1389203 RepID=A0A9Q3P2H8_9BASI|nr:hypothetical protein [Austropuccinia psidii MF-1]